MLVLISITVIRTAMYDGVTLFNRPVLCTEAVFLRIPHKDDVEAIVAVLSDWEVARWLSLVPHPYTPEDALFFLEHIVANEWVWAITAPGSSELIGAVNLIPHHGSQSAELGYWLSRHWWDRGIVTEAANLAISFAFTSLGFSQITAGYFKGNAASARVLEKLGFATLGPAMRPGPANSGYVPGVNTILYRPEQVEADDQLAEQIRVNRYQT